ncbi:hypothetical protein C8Q80DRAFT_1118727 [Daedaleopsis nitida]|nr:hypothetical protein C8Q80DRAFT_1118727 [Daedaleopsis nitida]
MNFSSTLYLHTDTSRRYALPLDMRPREIILTVDGPTAREPFMLTSVIQLVLPIPLPRPSVLAMDISAWLATLSGIEVRNADMTPRQREVLVKLVCAYSAYLEMPTGVEPRGWSDLISRLSEAALRLTALEDVEGDLVAITDWLEETLPASVFLPLFDQSYEPPPLAVNDEDKRHELFVMLTNMLHSDVVNPLRQGGDLVPPSSICVERELASCRPSDSDAMSGHASPVPATPMSHSATVSTVEELLACNLKEFAEGSSDSEFSNTRLGRRAETSAATAMYNRREVTLGALLAQIAASAMVEAGSENGDSSDNGSMPSLMTVADSSNGEYKSDGKDDGKDA